MNQSHKIFKFSIQQYKIGFIGMLLNLTFLVICFLFNWEILAKLVFTIGFVLPTYFLIDIMVSYYEVSEGAIKKKTLTKETIINWKDVKRVIEDPRSLKGKCLVHVFCIDKSLYIPYWINNNNNELMLEILKKVRDNDDTYIQPSLLELITSR